MVKRLIGYLERLWIASAGFKIGFQAFSALGMEAFPLFEQNGYKTFVDLKIHDIPNRVARDVGTMTKHGANMITMHASGGFEMMQAARHGADDAAYKANILKPILLGVTVLTSMDEIEFQQTFGSARQLPEQVTYLAQQAKKAGLDGVVASPLEIEAIRKACGDNFLIVTPGYPSEVGRDRRPTSHYDTSGGDSARCRLHCRRQTDY